MGKKGRSRSPEQRAIAREREQRVWELTQQGWSQYRIAREIGMSQTGVSRVLARIEKRFFDREHDRVLKVKMIEDGVIRHKRDEALQEWERSKKPLETKTIKGHERGTKGQDAGGVVDKSMIQTQEERLGDTRYLQIALECSRELRAIWGADAPIRTESKTEIHTRGKSLGEMTDAELERIARGGEGGEGTSGGSSGTAEPAGGTNEPA